MCDSQNEIEDLVWFVAWSDTCKALLCNKTDVTFLCEDNVFHVLRCKWWVKQSCCVQYACEPVLVDKNV